jgi:hypothetical protein
MFGQIGWARGLNIIKNREAQEVTKLFISEVNS